MKRREFMQLFGAAAALMGAAPLIRAAGDDWEDEIPREMKPRAANAEIVRVMAMRHFGPSEPMVARMVELALFWPGYKTPVIQWGFSSLLPFDWVATPGMGIIGPVNVVCSDPDVIWCMYYRDGKDLRFCAGGREGCDVAVSLAR